MNHVNPASLVNIAGVFVTGITLLSLLVAVLRLSYNPSAANIQVEMGKATAMYLEELAKLAQQDARLEDEVALLRQASAVLKACSAWKEYERVLKLIATRYMELGEAALAAGSLEDAATQFERAQTSFLEANDKEGQITAVRAMIPISAELGGRKYREDNKLTIMLIKVFAQLKGVEFDAESELDKAVRQTSDELLDAETSRLRKLKSFTPPRWLNPVFVIFFIAYLVFTYWELVIYIPSLNAK